MSRQDDVVRHMCPACGWPALAECTTCAGTGLVDDGQLRAYNRAWNEQVSSGARLINPAAHGPRRTFPAPRRNP
jgi:hypothetical protein